MEISGNKKGMRLAKTDFDLTNSGRLESTALEIENAFNFNDCGNVTLIKDLTSNSNQIKNNVLIVDNLDSFT